MPRRGVVDSRNPGRALEIFDKRDETRADTGAVRQGGADHAEEGNHVWRGPHAQRCAAPRAIHASASMGTHLWRNRKQRRRGAGPLWGRRCVRYGLSAQRTRSGRGKLCAAVRRRHLGDHLARRQAWPVLPGDRRIGTAIQSHLRQKGKRVRRVAPRRYRLADSLRRRGLVPFHWYLRRCFGVGGSGVRGGNRCGAGSRIDRELRPQLQVGPVEPGRSAQGYAAAHGQCGRSTGWTRGRRSVPGRQGT